MNLPPTPPSPGMPISSGFFTRLIRWVKSGMLIDGKNYRVSRGPNGTSIEFNNPGSLAAQTSLPQCFDIERVDADGVTNIMLKNCYLMVGGRILKSETQNLGDCSGMIVCARVDLSGYSTAIDIYMASSLSELESDQADKAYYIRPLYWFGQDGKVMVDFRSMPDLNAWEFE